MEQFAPPVESYLPTKRFEYTLSQKEKDFAQLVAVGSTPAEAIVLAGILREDDPTLTPSDYYLAAARLLKLPSIQERIAHYRDIHRQSMAISAERILQESAAMAFSDPASLFETDGRPIRNIHQVPRHARAAIKEWGFTKDGEFKFKLYDKNKPLEFIADIEGITAEANRAKAPQINISIGDGNVTIGDSPSPVQTSLTSGHRTHDNQPRNPSSHSSTINSNVSSSSIGSFAEDDDVVIHLEDAGEGEFVHNQHDHNDIEDFLR